MEVQVVAINCGGTLTEAGQQPLNQVDVRVAEEPPRPEVEVEVGMFFKDEFRTAVFLSKEQARSLVDRLNDVLLEVDEQGRPESAVEVTVP